MPLLYSLSAAYHGGLRNSVSVNEFVVRSPWRHPEILKEAGDLGLLAERHWISLIARSNLIVEESVPEQVAIMKAELAGPEPTPLDRLLIDQIGLAWLQLHAA